jgi:DNA-binding beta-propeller fold protein YncE
MGVLAPGTLLGGCRIEAIVGRGGMGVVYRARQLDLDRDVAVKVIAPELVADPEIRKRFLSEARAAGAVEHPNVVPVHAAGVTEELAYLVMRFVSGDDLRTVVLAHGGLAPERAARIAVRLGDALDAIHRAGYVHRDVKPQNVLLDDTGHVYLSDFGLAKRTLATAGQTRPEQWVGTLDYVAPEQIRGERVDARADVYSLGGVLYFMLTGRVPFERESEHAKLWAHLSDPPPRPSTKRPELPVELDAIVLRALAKDPAERYPSAGDLGRAARSAAGLAGETGPERTVARGAAAPATTVVARNGVAQARSGKRRRPVVAAAALTVAVAVPAFLLLRGDDNDRALRGPGLQPTAKAEPRVGETYRDVGFRPSGVIVANRRVWVTSASRERITSIDVDTGSRDGPQPLVGKGTADIARDGDTLWVVARRRRAVLGVSTRTGNVIRHLDTSSPPIRVASGAGGLWVVVREEPGGPATLLRYSREGLGEPMEIEFRDGIAAMTAGGGYLWFALAQLPRVMRIPAGGTEPEHAGWLGDTATDVAYGAGHLWVSVGDDDSVARIDPRTKLSPATVIANNPGQLAVARNRVFVAASLDDTVVTLDPRTGEPVGRQLQVPKNPYGVAAGAGHVWVTGLGDNTLTRIDY